MEIIDKKIVIIICLFLIIWGIFFRVINLDKDITAEESDFVKPAIAIVESGRPLFYHSEQIPSLLAMYHPPMYIYTLSLIAMISTKEIALRSLNFIFVLLTALIIYLFCIRINREYGKQAGLLATVLFLTNYYVFSSSLVIDIDVFSMFFVFCFFYFVFLYRETGKIAYAILASIVFLFALANRYPIAILTFIAVGFYFLIKKETRKFTWKYFIIGLVGGLIFLAIWTIYSTIIEPGTFFAFISHNTQLGAEQFSNITLYVASFCLNISQIVRLYTLPALFLSVISIFYFIKRKEEPLRIIFIYCITIFLFFVIVPRPAFGYPRYFLTMMPGLSILISILILEIFIKEKVNNKNLIFGLLIGLLSLCLLIILNPQLTSYSADGLIKATNFPDFIFNILCIFPILLIFIFKKQDRKIFLVIALIGALLAYSMYFEVKYTLNDSKIKEAGEYIKNHTNDSDTIIVPKAVGYYAERKFYVNDNNKPSIEKLSKNYVYNYILESFKNMKMNSPFFWPNGIYSGIYPPFPQEKELNKAIYVVKYYPVGNLTPEKIIGDFYIYKLK